MCERGYYKQHEITNMSKPIFSVREHIDRLEFTRQLKTVVVTFMLSSVTAAGAENVKYYAKRNVIPFKETVVGGQNATLNRVMPAVNTSFKAAIAFDKLTERMPEAVEMKPVATFITEGIGSIETERVSMDYDMKAKVLNVSYCLPGDLLLSINKPYDTMEDIFVMFSIYHNRRLLVSETVSIDLLAQYIRNVEKKIAEA